MPPLDTADDRRWSATHDLANRPSYWLRPRAAPSLVLGRPRHGPITKGALAEMLFSTKAEYGVRLMVELGRRDGDGAPVALATIAESETLPLSYLEHLVAKLRAEGFVTSVRGAHGGYRLARPAAEIRMLDVVQALEGPISPMECFETDGEGRVLCSHETDGDRACATKLLWTRVQGGVTKALAGTTLAELAEFADAHSAPVREPLAGSAA